MDDKVYKELKMKSFLMAISGVLILWLPVLLLHLSIVLFAALITYSASNLIAEKLRRVWPKGQHLPLLGVLALLAILAGSGYVFGDWLVDKTGSLTITSLLTQAAVILDQVHTHLPTSIAEHVPHSLESLKVSLSNAMKSHAGQVQTVGIHTLRGLGYVIAGFVIGAVAVIQTSGEKAAYAKPLSRLVHAEFTELLHGFTDIFYAQIKISAINTVLTAVYLLGILPLIGKPLPMAGTLVMVTFFAGLLPVGGNLISNTFIVILSLSDSLAVTIMSLAWLVGIHKLEYFLNAHIIGHKIKAAMWELLIVMIVLEAAFGMAGLVSAPVIYAQAKRSLHNHGWI